MYSAGQTVFAVFPTAAIVAVKNSKSYLFTNISLHDKGRLLEFVNDVIQSGMHLLKWVGARRFL